MISVMITDIDYKKKGGLMALKYSRQREAIKEFLMTRKDHPTADVVYENVRKEFPNISLGTVYRNLTLLSDMGELLRLNLGDGMDHFDATTTPHNHFICQKCGRVIDLDMEPLSFVDTTAQKSFKGSITGHVIYFYGICEGCENQKS